TGELARVGDTYVRGLHRALRARQALAICALDLRDRLCPGLETEALVSPFAPTGIASAGAHSGMAHTAKRLFWAMNLGGLTVRVAATRTWKRVSEHAILTRAAAISFYATAALIPFLGLLIALSAHWLPWILGGSTNGPLPPVAFNLLDSLLPRDAVSLIAREIARLRGQAPTGLISAGLVVLLWLSSSVYMEVIDAMNVILNAREARPFWKRRLIAAAMTIGQAAILIAATITIVAWRQIMKFLGLGPLASTLATLVHGLMVFIMVLLSFALALHVAPDAEQDWVWITPGSLLGTVVVLGGSVL